MPLGPDVRSEELEVEVGGLGRGIDSILPAGPVLAVAGPVVVTATKVVATAVAEHEAAATSPVVAVAKSGRIRVVCVSKIVQSEGSLA